MVIIPMFIVSCLSLYISVNSIKERIERRNTAIRNTINHSVTHFEEALLTIDELLTDGSLGVVKNNHDLRILEKANHTFEKLQILNLEGVVEYSSGEDENLGLDLSNFEFVKNAIEANGFFWSNVISSFKDQSPEIMIAKRFGSEILVGSINIEDFYSLVQGTVKNTGSKVSILDTDGNIVINILKGLDIQKDTLNFDYVYKSENQEMKKRSFLKGRDKFDVIQSYGKIDKTGWDIVIIEEGNRGFILAWDFYRHLVLGISLFTLGMIYLSHLAISRFTGDMKKLNTISEKVAAGKLPKMLKYELLEAEELAYRFLLMGEVLLKREESIKEETNFLENLLEAIPNPVFYKDKNHVYLGGNKAFADYLGIEKHEIAGKTVYDVAPEDMADIYMEADDKILDAGETQVYQGQVIDSDNKTKDVKFYKSVFKNSEGEKLGIIGVMLDVTNLKEAIRTSEKKEKLLESLLYTIPLPTFYQDKDGRYINCNRAFEDIVGKKKNDILGKCHLEVWENNFTDYCNVKDKELMKEQKLQKFEYNIIDQNKEKRILVFDKTVFHNENKEVGGIIGVMSDITEIRKLQDELKKISVKDSLTGIYNRRGFEEMSNRNLKDSLRNKNNVSIIMVDIDRFKLYNDTYGHQAGDECLKEIAEKLEESCKRSMDIVARYGGEEFIILLPDTDLDGARMVAKKINKNIQDMKIEHVKSEHGEIVTVSIGVASDIPKDEKSLEKLIGLADKMLYLAKESGRNRVEG